jgi:quinol monooxygenase YgiN
MSIKVIVELQVKPGKREQLLATLRAIGEEHGPRMSGYLGSTRYQALNNPDMLIEIAEWESAEAQKLHIEKATAGEMFAPLLEFVAAPFKATVIQELP